MTFRYVVLTDLDDDDGREFALQVADDIREAMILAAALHDVRATVAIRVEEVTQ